MKNWKTLLFAFMSVGLLAACSSEEDITTPKTDLDNELWQSLNMTLSVPEGTTAVADDIDNRSTRAMGELDQESLLPRAHYPSNLPVYMCRYDDNSKEVAEWMVIRAENAGTTDESVHYYYQIKDGNVLFTTNVNNDNAQVLSVKIGSYKGGDLPSSKTEDSDLFFFASHNEVKDVHFPTLTKAWGPYNTDGKTCEEFGDKLFSTDGYFFQWKDEGMTRAGLYLIVRNDYIGTEIKEIKEISNWQKADWNLAMSRMAACVSVRLMLIDHFNSNGTIENIAGMNKYTGRELGMKLTNEALQNYLADDENKIFLNNYPGVANAMKDFKVENIFVLKKALHDFPCIFDWENGLQAESANARKSLLMCNLDFPAWVDEMTSYEHGSSNVAALTATCDNEPFIPADGKFIPRVKLALYMGIGNQANNDYAGNVIQYIIPFGDSTTGSNSYHVTPNTHTYIYVGITLKNIVELYYHLIMNPSPAAARSGEIPSIELSSDQIMTFSEPYRSSEN